MAKPPKLEALRLQPIVGEWYRNKSDPFEVIVYDEDDGTIEVQYFDGTLEEFDIDDWRAQSTEGALQSSEAPEDFHGAYDYDSEEDEPIGRADDYDSASGGLRASGLDGLDLFE
ncbi:MAG: DUF6763 family protein [Steroidobacteraceae bacterium]